MNRRNALVVLCGPLAGCYVAEVGPERTEKKIIPMDDTEMLTAELKIAAGEVRAGTNTSELLDATFRYNVDAWKPSVRYSAMSFRGHLTIEQPRQARIGENLKYEWDLQFNPKKALDLRLNFGAGKAELLLGKANLRGIEINMGVGDLTLDLRGHPERGYPVRISGGVGNAEVRLPRDVRLEARARGGLGNIEVTGMRKSGERYVNAEPVKSRTWISLDIQGGVGSIKLIAD